MSAKIFYQGREVGECRDDGYFQKHMQFSRHLLQKPRQSIAINVDVLDQAEELGAHSCEIHDSESGKVYRASIADIRGKGFALNRGQGPQIALPLQLWETESHPVTPTETPAAHQLSLEGLQ